jgi:hypothetical protein
MLKFYSASHRRRCNISPRTAPLAAEILVFKPLVLTTVSCVRCFILKPQVKSQVVMFGYRTGDEIGHPRPFHRYVKRRLRKSRACKLQRRGDRLVKRHEATVPLSG